MPTDRKPRLLFKVKPYRPKPEVGPYAQPCQSCSDEAHAWRLALPSQTGAPERIVWLCRMCSGRYAIAATRQYGHISLTLEGA